MNLLSQVLRKRLFSEGGELFREQETLEIEGNSNII